MFPTRRNSLRLQGFDYSAQCSYFITIVTQGRMCRFGDVCDGELVLNDAGKKMEEAWQLTLGQFPDTADVAHVIMPNHVHLLVSSGGTTSVTEVVRWFKSKSTSMYVNGVKELGWPRFESRLWQTRFYDVIIRNSRAHEYVENYIYNNPQRWSLDRLNADADLTRADNVSAALRLINW